MGKYILGTHVEVCDNTKMVWRVFKTIRGFIFQAGIWLGAVACIFVWLGVKPKDLWGWRVPITAHHWIWLAVAILLFITGISTSGYALYQSSKQSKEVDSKIHEIQQLTSEKQEIAEQLRILNIQYKALEYRSHQVRGDIEAELKTAKTRMATMQDEIKRLKEAQGSLLAQRTFDAARNIRKQWIDFKERSGGEPAKPDYAALTPGQGQEEEISAEYFGKFMGWQDRARGWYEGKVKDGLFQIRSELAEHGLTDQDLDDNIGLRSPTEESIQIICQRLKWLASQLDI
jgi:hypothetical protein